jgi:hypothetical protein
MKITGWSKSLCAPDDYSKKNTQKCFKQFQSLIMITYLELGITDDGSVSLVSPWRDNKCLETGGEHFEHYV